MSEKQIFKNLIRKINNDFNLVIWNAENDPNQEDHLDVLNYLCHQEISRSEENQTIFYTNFGLPKVILIIENLNDQNLFKNLAEIKKMHPKLDAFLINNNENLKELTQKLDSFKS